MGRKCVDVEYYLIKLMFQLIVVFKNEKACFIRGCIPTRIFFDVMSE